jgi:nitroimidazol reductase NimA-like FMN-containing flavoprotein (pyridoxamine 5'-phosphate oxidase superfamily)
MSENNPYPQGPPLSPEELETFLKEAPIARLGSLNEDGTIHLVPVWFKYEDGRFVIGTQAVCRKARNVQANDGVTLLIDTQEPPYKGVMVYGKARLDYEDAIAEKISIFEKYVTPQEARSYVQGSAEKHVPVVLRIEPTDLISYDYS